MKIETSSESIQLIRTSIHTHIKYTHTHLVWSIIILIPSHDNTLHDIWFVTPNCSLYQLRYYTLLSALHFRAVDAQTSLPPLHSAPTLFYLDYHNPRDGNNGRQGKALDFSPSPSQGLSRSGFHTLLQAKPRTAIECSNRAAPITISWSAFLSIGGYQSNVETIFP